MAGGLTYLGAQFTLRHILRAEVPTYPATFYLRLLTAPSTKGASGTESTYGSYSRLALVRSTSLFSDPVLTGRSSNSTVLTFPTPTTSGADLVGFDIVNTSSGAFTQTYVFGSILPQRSIVVGKVLRFSVGALVVTA